MTFKIIYQKRALKKLHQSTNKATELRIYRTIGERLSQQPQHAGRALSGSLKGLWRLRLGPWRVVYQIIENTVIIWEIQSRDKIYQQVRKLL